jgi:S-formylglutathione hydrolase FrmB
MRSARLALAAVILVASACSSGSKAAAPPEPTSTTSPGYQPPRFIDLSQLAQVEAGARQADGRTAAGTTVVVDIPGTLSHFDARDALVYLPPAWFASSTPRLPTLLLLPGVPGGPEDWTDDGDADLIANDFARDHDGNAPVIVMPDVTGQEDGDSECVNSTKYGAVEAYLTEDVPAYVRSIFRASVGPGSLAVAGASAGGTCSTVLALRNPTVFRTFASFSGFTTPTYLDDTIAESVPILYNGSEAAYRSHDPLTLLAQNQYPETSAWYDSGTGDHQPWEDVNRLAAASRRAGMNDVCLLGIPGGHTWEVWQQSLSAALPWLSAHLGLTPAPAESLLQCSP